MKKPHLCALIISGLFLASVSFAAEHEKRQIKPPSEQPSGQTSAVVWAVSETALLLGNAFLVKCDPTTQVLLHAANTAYHVGEHVQLVSSLASQALLGAASIATAGRFFGAASNKPFAGITLATFLLFNAGYKIGSEILRSAVNT